MTHVARRVRGVPTRVLMFAASIVVLALRVGAAQADVSGVVFHDVNNNGVRDSAEPGISGVAVSNQDAVVVTDASGAYRLARRINGLVFVSLPDGYRIAGPFWRRITTDSASLDFPLASRPRSTEFTFIHASDPHVAPAVVARMQRFRDLANTLNPAFVLITGDLVRDALRVGEAEATGYYELFEREVAPFASPVWTVPGNHEIFGVERTLSKVSESHPLYGRAMYHHYRGPDYYSFTYGGVHFVALNTVDVDDQSYYGHVDATQLAWLERDLAHIPPDMPVVTFSHIPFFSSAEIMGGYTESPPAPTLITVNGRTVFRHTVSNAGAVLALLRRQRLEMALAGHTHAGEQTVYAIEGVPTRFNQVAAIVGPRASASLQFTSGFTVYTVRNAVIDVGRFVSLGLDGRR